MSRLFKFEIKRMKYKKIHIILPLIIISIGLVGNKEQCERYPDLGYCFEEYTRRRIEMRPTLNSGKLGMSFMRVMPVMKR